MKTIEVFDGCQLHDSPVPCQTGPVRCRLTGSGGNAG